MLRTVILRLRTSLVWRSINALTYTVVGVLALIATTHLAKRPLTPPSPRPEQPPARTSTEEEHSHLAIIPPLFVGGATSLQHDVPVKNTTDRTIRFTDVRPSCACAGGSRLAAMELAPGQETVLHFDIDLRQRKGPQSFLFQLVEETGTVWCYTLQTTLYERAHFADAGSIHFGMVAPSTEQVRATHFMLHAETSDLLPKTVVFRSDSENLRLEAGCDVLGKEADGTVVRQIPVKLRLQPPNRPGLGQTLIWAAVDSPKGKLEVQNSVTWNIRSCYSIIPGHVFFDNVESLAGGPPERRVLVQRSDGKPLAIRRIVVPCSAVKCQADHVSESTILLRFSLDTSLLTTALWEEAVVETDHFLQPTVKIPVAALKRTTPFGGLMIYVYSGWNRLALAQGD